MPSLLARLKKSPSPSTSPQRARSASGSSLPEDDGLPSSARSRASTKSSLGTGVNVDDDDDEPTPTGLAPALATGSAAGQPSSTLTPDSKRPTPLNTTEEKSRPLGTPRLVLTEEGSNSPRSFTSSPQVDASPSARQTVGLGIDGGGVNLVQKMDEEVETPKGDSFDVRSIATAPAAISSEPDNRDVTSIRSASIDGQSRRGSIAQRVADKLHAHPSSPVAAFSNVLSPSVSTEGKSIKSKKSKKSRRGSAGSHGVAAALARSGLHIAGAHGADEGALHTSKRSVSQGRSPFLVRPKHEKEGTEVDDGLSAHDDDDDGYYDEDGSEEEGSDSEGDVSLPVTGFAVASNRRNAEFHQVFPSVDESDYLIDDYGCALAKDILVQGRLYVSENHICFHANIFGWVTDVVVPFSEIKSIEKKMTALVIPNAIGISNGKDKYTFASLISRDSTYDVMMNVWRLVNPGAVMSSTSLITNGVSRPPSIAEEAEEDEAAGGSAKSPTKGKARKTQCTCGAEGKHYSETALDAVFPSSPEKIYNLMFNSGFFKSFLSDDQKLKDIESSDWKPMNGDGKKLTRSTSYIKPLNGSIGPKQTKCHITDELEHQDYDNYISMITTTRTPDVPSGGVFSVKTRTCLTWAGANSTKVLVTTQVEWTGKSWVKGIIEKSAIEGQKQYHEDLDRGMRAYIKEHSSEFVGEGGELALEEEEAEEAEAANKDGGAAPTAAQEYAARTRQQRQSDDYWHLQGAFDSVVSGLGSIGSGLKGVFESLSDLVGDAPVSKETLMAVLIVLLVLSNIYTYVSGVNSASKAARKARRIARLGVDPEIETAVRVVLAERKALSPVEEARELGRLLDEVEGRAKRLREVVGRTGASLADLD